MAPQSGNPVRTEQNVPSLEFDFREPTNIALVLLCGLEVLVVKHRIEDTLVKQLGRYSAPDCLYQRWVSLIQRSQVGLRTCGK